MIKKKRMCCERTGKRKPYFLISVLVVLLSSCLGWEDREAKGEIRRIEHFYVSTANAKELFGIFANQFDLPVVWDYQNWGTFSSGGVTLGNAVLEWIENTPDSKETYYGIALEPGPSLGRMVVFLDSAEISHGQISRARNWSTMSLRHLLPESVNVFICDYHDREKVRHGRKTAADQLVSRNGGPLGILALKAIIVSTPEPAELASEWAKIPGVRSNGRHFSFPEGPDVILTASDTLSFGLLIQVKSLREAQVQLEALGFTIRHTGKEISLVEDEFPLQIRLSELGMNEITIR